MPVDEFSPQEAARSYQGAWQSCLMQALATMSYAGLARLYTDPRGLLDCLEWKSSTKHREYWHGHMPSACPLWRCRLGCSSCAVVRASTCAHSQQSEEQYGTAPAVLVHDQMRRCAHTCRTRMKAGCCESADRRSFGRRSCR